MSHLDFIYPYSTTPKSPDMIEPYDSHRKDGPWELPDTAPAYQPYRPYRPYTAPYTEPQEDSPKPVYSPLFPLPRVPWDRPPISIEELYEAFKLEEKEKAAKEAQKDTSATQAEEFSKEALDDDTDYLISLTRIERAWRGELMVHVRFEFRFGDVRFVARSAFKDAHISGGIDWLKVRFPGDIEDIDAVLDSSKEACLSNMADALMELLV